MSFRDDMEAIVSAYVAAYKSRDAAKCAAIYAEGATIYSPFGPPVTGRSAIRAEHETWFEIPEKNKRIDIINCAATGYIGYCLLAYSSDVTGPDGMVQQEAGTNLCAMERQSGLWQIRYSSMNEIDKDRQEG